MGTFQLVFPILLTPILVLVSRLAMKLVPTLYFPASPARFQVKASPAADDSLIGKGAASESLTLKEFVESRVPR